MWDKRLADLPTANDTLALLISTHLQARGYVITRLTPFTVSPVLSGVLTCHYPTENLAACQELLWVLDAACSCIRGYVQAGDGGWIESHWALNWLASYNHQIALAFADFFAVLRERAAESSSESSPTVA